MDFFLQEWKRKYEILKNDSQDEKERIQLENQTIYHENMVKKFEMINKRTKKFCFQKLKHDIEELSIQIRLQIQEEVNKKNLFCSSNLIFILQYRQLLSVKETAIQVDINNSFF